MANKRWRRLALAHDQIESSFELLRTVQQRLHMSAIDPTLSVILGEAFEIDKGSVAVDAAVMAAWRLPLDDLLTHICQSRHWQPDSGIIYLGALRSALLKRPLSSPWDDL